MKTRIILEQKFSWATLIFGFTFLFGIVNSSLAQGQNLPKEKVSFHTPKTLYFTGEKLWFDAEVALGSVPSSSQILYAELLDRNSNSIAHIKVPIREGKSVNFLSLSDQIPSDHYLLRVYTRISPHLDMDLGMAQQLVTIINPRIPPKYAQQADRIPLIPEKVYSKGSQLQFSLNPSSGKQVLASGISIANPFLNEEHKQWTSTQLYTSLKSEPLLPELFGHQIQAKVTSLDTTLTYFLSVHGEKSVLFTDHADATGRLVFDLGGMRHWDRIILQLENGEEMQGLEVLAPVIQTTFRSDFSFPELALSQEDLPLLQPLLKASLIQTYYLQEIQKDSLQVVTGFVADYTYDLDDYTRFEDIETILKEYVPSVSVRIRDKKKTFRLLNEANKSVFDAKPLILVDAMPVFDSDLLASFNPKLLNTLEILNREFYLNDRTYPGVISFSSYSNNFGLFPLAPAARFFDYQGLHPWIDLPSKQFTLPSSQDRIPDWRTVLAWEKKSPEVSTQLSQLEGIFLFWQMVDEGEKATLQRSYFQVK